MNDLESLGLDEAGQRRLQQWRTAPRYSALASALEARVSEARSGDDDARAELQDAFCQDLPIGTGGRRGPTGIGPNRMNAVVIRETAHGLARVVLEEGGTGPVMIVYDTRKDSRAFAFDVARQLSASGLSSIVLDAPRPTPQLSFEVLRRGCSAGVVLSASHNPPTDNGIKIYGPDGAQVLGKRDRALFTAIRETAAGAELPAVGTADDPLPSGVTVESPEASDEAYHAYVLSQGVTRDDLGEAGLQVVFTPLHGVGHHATVPVLQRRGANVASVARQVDDDGGNFSTVESANPESPAAFELALQQARETEAHLVLATDPDADRLGAFARAADGEFRFIDGNRLGVLMLDHVLRNAVVPPQARVVTTLVSSPLLGTLARAAEVEVIDDILVGFKHHAGVVVEAPERPLLFACEESHGYLRGNDVRDKDGPIAALLLTELASSLRAQGKTLFDRLDEVWTEHGYHYERTQSLWAHGAVGREAIAAVMKTLRSNPPSAVGALNVASVEDRLAPRNTGSPTRDLPGNVLSFELEGGEFACRMVLRPSGTEPKLKVYVLARGPASDRPAVEACVEEVLTAAAKIADDIMTPVLEGSATGDT